MQQRELDPLKSMVRISLDGGGAFLKVFKDLNNHWSSYVFYD